MAGEGASYFVGQCPDVALLLKWAGSQGNRELTRAEVQSCKKNLCLDGDPIQMSQCVWSLLQMPLMGAGTRETDYNNTSSPEEGVC